MNKIVFCVLLITPCSSDYAQNLMVFKTRNKATITWMNPEWLNTKSTVIKNSAVRNDSVFYYDTKENNQDSALILAQYFDSLGNLLERDEYSIKKKGEIWRISNFNYMGDDLFKKEIITKADVNNTHTNGYQKEIFTYEYDSTGNVITVKLYNYPNSTINAYTLTTQENEYDSSGHLVKEFLNRGGGNRFLHHTYVYDKGVLVEFNTYDSTGDLTIINSHRYDNKKNILRIYLGEFAPDNLRMELFYDGKERLMQKKIYWENGVAYLNHSY